VACRINGKRWPKNSRSDLGPLAPLASDVLKKSLILALLCTAILVGLGVFVWPTRYRYDHVKMGENDFPLRTDRLSGRSEMLTPQYGWHTLGRPAETQNLPVIQELPTERLAKLEGQASVDDVGWIEVHVYNGSDWTVSEITVLVTVLDAQNNQILSRPYRLAGGPSTPQSDTRFRDSLGFTLAKGQAWTWSITSAKGKPG
jgi:hypothetical protein